MLLKISSLEESDVFAILIRASVSSGFNSLKSSPFETNSKLSKKKLSQCVTNLGILYICANARTIKQFPTSSVSLRKPTQ
uniref:Uncharacterized protein n=1 Tax=Ciona savignyi TaxID=51511 RepID=H2YZ29_CIOSA